MRGIIKNLNLKYQLILVSLTTILIATISMMIILPIFLTPFYEKNLYEMLKQPLPFITGEHNRTNQRIAYIIKNKNEVIVSKNFNRVLEDNSVEDITNSLNGEYGKISLNNNVFYFQTSRINNDQIIAITDDSYIEIQRDSLNSAILPIMVLTLVLTLSILIIYSNHLVKKITMIKNKIDHFDDNKYKHSVNFEINDELQALNLALEQARINLMNREKYKNNMFQSISHELKTPIMVISSHVEAAMDKAISNKEALGTIKEEISNLNNQVEAILQMNKLNYMKDTDIIEEINLANIIKDSVKRFKVMRNDITWQVNIDKQTIYTGNKELWQMVINNLLSNFIRFADKEIKIELNQEKLSMVNDGEKIEETLLKSIFEPYQKSNKKGQTGLGLAIVKECLDFMNYKIAVNNLDNGVNFIIKK